MRYYQLSENDLKKLNVEVESFKDTEVVAHLGITRADIETIVKLNDSEWEEFKSNFTGSPEIGAIDANINNFILRSK